jgi:hypothetical protein
MTNFRSIRNLGLVTGYLLLVIIYWLLVENIQKKPKFESIKLRLLLCKGLIINDL